MKGSLLLSSLTLAMALTSFGFAACVCWMAYFLRRRETLLSLFEATNRDLQDARKNLLIVCAWTHQVLDDGEWICFEDYLKKHLGLTVSHGISEQARQEQMKYIEEHVTEKH